MKTKQKLSTNSAPIALFFSIVLVTVFTVMLVTVSVVGRPEQPRAAQTTVNFEQDDWSGGSGQILFINKDAFLSKDTVETDVPGVITLPATSTVFEPNDVYSPGGSVETLQTAIESEPGTLQQWTAALAKLTNGNYVGVWFDASSSSSISGKIFDTDPATPESPFMISTADSPPSGVPSVAALPNGRFVVTWTGTDVAGGGQSGRALFYRRFTADGTAADAGAVVVDTCPKLPAPITGSSCIQAGRSVASDSSGRFYIVWSNRQVDFSPPFTPSQLTVYQKSYQDVQSDLALERYTSQLVDSGTSADAISVAAQGDDVAMTWHDVTLAEVLAVVWDASGTPKAAEKFTVAPLESSQAPSDIALAPDGTLRIAYVTADLGQDCLATAEHARVIHYQQDGTLIGSPIDVETTPASGCEWQQIPALAMLETGDFVIVWSQYESATPTFGAQEVTDTYAQVISASDAAITSPTRISIAATHTNDPDVHPAVAYDPDNAQVMIGWQGWVDADFSDTYFETALYDLASLYATTGELFSSVAERDGGIWGTVTYSATTPVGTSVDLAVRTGPGATPDGSWSDFVTVPNGGSVPTDLASGQFLQYRVTLVSNGSQTPSVDSVSISLLQAGSVTRIDESDPVQLAIELSKLNFSAAQSAANVVIARSDNVVDTLAVTAFARLVNAPILLTSSDSVLPEVATEIERVLTPGGTIFIAGGEVAITPAVATELTQSGYTTSRFNGDNRNHTARLIAEAIVTRNPGPTTSVIIAENRAFADSLGGGAAAGLLQGGNVMPILLTERGELSLGSDAETFLGQNSIALTSVHILGGPVAITTEVEASIGQILPDAAITRYSGDDRFETNALLNAAFFAAPTVAVIANGEQAGLLGARSGVTASSSFFSALLAGTTATSRSAPLLISTSAELPASILGYLQEHGSAITSVILVGGEDLLGQAVEDAAAALL